MVRYGMSKQRQKESKRKPLLKVEKHHLDGVCNDLAREQRILHAGSAVGFTVANDDGVVNERLSPRSLDLQRASQQERDSSSTTRGNTQISFICKR